MAVGGGSGGAAGSIRAGRAHVEMTAKDAGLTKSLDGIQRRMKSVASTIAKLGAGFLALGGTVLGSLTAAFKGAINHFDMFQKASRRLGASTETLSALGYAAQISGSNFEEMEKSIKKMQQGLADAEEGTGAAAEAFAALGLDAKKLIDLPLEEQMGAISDALAAIENTTKKAAMAMEIFGARGGTRLSTMLAGGSEGIRKLMQEAERVGSVVGGEEALRAERAGDAITRAWLAVKNTFFQVGAAILPQIETIEKLSFAIVDGVKVVRDWIKDNQKLVLVVAAVAAGVMAAGAALVGIGVSVAAAAVALGGLVTAASAVGSVLAAVFSGPGAIVIGVVAAVAALWGVILRLQYEFLTTTKTGKALGDTFKSMFAGLGDTLGLLKDALVAGEFSLAWELAVAQLRVIWEEFLVGAQQVWQEFVDEFVPDEIVGVWEVIRHEVEKHWEILKTGWKLFAEFVTKVWHAAVDWIGRQWDKLVQKIKEVIEWAKRNKDALIAAAPGAALAAGAIGLGMEEGKDIAGKVGDELEDIAEGLRAIGAASKQASRETPIDTKKLDAAKARLEELKNRVRGLKKEQKEGTNWALDQGIMLGLIAMRATKAAMADRPGAAGQLPAAASGSFSTFHAQQALGYGGIPDKIEKNTRRTADGIDELKDKMQQLEFE
jgi:hypothetical protein